MADSTIYNSVEGILKGFAQVHGMGLRYAVSTRDQSYASQISRMPVRRTIFHSDLGIENRGDGVARTSTAVYQTLCRNGWGIGCYSVNVVTKLLNEG